MTPVNWTELRRSLLGDYDPSVLPPKIRLPMLPHAVLEFSRRAEDPNTGPGELGRIIENDTGLTCELLKYANSSRFGLKNKASTAQQAITTLGIRNSKVFLLTAGVHESMKACKSKLINFQTFWLTNLERALFAKEVARLLGANADIAFAGSMLHDFLLPLLSTEEYETYLKFTQIDELQRPRLTDYERQAFGWDHSYVAAQVLLSWNFPDELICCVLSHHGGLELLRHLVLGKTAIAAVAVAALIPDALRQSGAGMERLIQLDSVWPNLHLQELADRVAKQMHEMTPLAAQHLSLQRRCEKSLATQGA